MSANGAAQSTIARSVPAVASAAASGAGIDGLLTDWDDQSTKTTGPLAGLFKGQDGQGIPLLVEVLALWGLCLLVWLIVKLFYSFSNKGWQAMVRPRERREEHRVKQQNSWLWALVHILAPLFTFRNIKGSSWVELKKDQLADVSLDYICYMLFCRCCCQIAGCWSVAAILLILLDLDYNYSQNGSLAATAVLGTLSNHTETAMANSTSDLNSVRDGILDFATVQFVDGGTLYWHVGVSYWNTLTALLILWQYWRVAVYLRTMYLQGRGDDSQQRSCIILVGPDADKPIGGTKLPGETSGQYRRLKDAVDDNRKAVEKVEAAFQSVVELGQGGDTKKLDDLAGTVYRALKDIAAFKSDANAVLREISVRELDTMGRKPSFRTKKSKAGYSVNLFNSREEAREAYMRIHEDQRSCFMRLPLINKCQNDGRVKKANLLLAPDDEDVNWANLCGRSSGLAASSWHSCHHATFSVLLAILCVLYTALIIGLSFLSSLEAWSVFWPGINRIKETSVGPTLLSILTDFVPPMLTAGCRLIMPYIIKRVATLRKPVTFSKGDRDITAWLFVALIVANLILFTSASVAWQILSDLKSRDHLEKAAQDAINAPTQIVQGYLAASRYWLTWVPSTVLTSTVAHMQGGRIFSMIWAKVRHRRDVTLRERRQYQAPDPNYPLGDRASNFLLLMAVCSAYSPLAGTVTLVGAFGVLFETLLANSELFHLYMNRADSGGHILGLLSNRLLWILAVIQPGIGASVLGLKLNWRAACCLAPLPVIVYLFFQELNHAWITRVFAVCGGGSDRPAPRSMVDQFHHGSDIDDGALYDMESGQEKSIYQASNDSTMSLGGPNNRPPPPYSVLPPATRNAQQSVGNPDNFPLLSVDLLVDKDDEMAKVARSKPSFASILSEQWVQPTLDPEIATALLVFLANPRYGHLASYFKGKNPIVIVEADPLSNPDPQFGNKFYTIPYMKVARTRKWA